MPADNSLDGTETQRCAQGLTRGVSTSLDEDGGRVEGDNIDLQCRTIDQRRTAYQVTVDFTHSAHLLRQHDGMRSQSSPSNSRDSEQLGNPSKESRRLGELGLLGILVMNGIEVSSGLQFAETETFERFESFLIATLFDEPSSGFGAEVDSEGERHGGDHGASELEPPVGDNQAEEEDRAGCQKPNQHRSDWYQTHLAAKPKKIPKAVQSCHDMTRAPRIEAGEFSAAKMGTVDPFTPIPSPSTRREARSATKKGGNFGQCLVQVSILMCAKMYLQPQDLAKPEETGVAIKQRAVRKMTFLRPR
jgi:hypothetical protein